MLPFTEAIQSEVIARRLEAGMISSFDYVGYGLYADKVKAWQESFPCIKIWIYEEFFNDLERYMGELTRFLKVDNLEKRLIPLKRVNPSGVARNEISQFFINRLQKPEWWKKPVKRFFTTKAAPEDQKASNTEVFTEPEHGSRFVPPAS